MKEIDYITLIHKELVGELSVADVAILKEWKEAHEDNMATYLDTVEIWELSSHYTPKLNINVSRAIDNQLFKIRQEELISAKSEAKVIPFTAMKWVTRIAALMVFVLSATFLFKSFSGESYASTNDVLYVQLSDGSAIWLDHHSKLSVDKSFGKDQRVVSLQGKAYFDIKRDESKPFIINAKDMDVTVLGTSFTVDASDDTPSVAVRSGKVKVQNDKNEVVITKGDKVESTLDGIWASEELSDHEFDWTNPDLSFKDAPLSTVLADLSKHFDIEFHYNGGVDLKVCPFTSKSLKNVSLRDILDILELTYDMEIQQKSDKQIKLSHIKCRK